MGCTSSTATTTGAGTNSAAPALTRTQAREVFDAYVAATGRGTRAGDAALALSLTAGVQHAVASAALTSGTFFRTAPSAAAQPGYSEYAYGTPAFYLPEPAGYPRFFVADVRQTLKGRAPSDGFAHRVGGVELPVNGPALLVFEQASASAPWLLGSDSQLPPGLTLPRLATDKNGYVPQVPLSATTLLARPDVTGPLQAAVVDDGQASAATRAVAAGPLTTGLYQGARAHVQGLITPPGDVYQWELEGTPFSTFALRIASGGALVLYSMYLNATVAVPDVINKAAPIRPGAPIQVPRDLLPLLPPGKTTPAKSLESQQLLSFAAIDPPAAPAKITVIAIGGGTDYAVAS